MTELLSSPTGTALIEDALEQHGTGAVVTPQGLDEIVKALEADPSLYAIWLTLAVLGKGLPTELEVRAGRRVVRNLGGTEFARRAAIEGRRGKRWRRNVELLRNAVIVDVRHTAETDLSTGIQRVARETVKRWHADHDVALVTWTNDAVAMRRLLPEELATALYAEPPVHNRTRVADKSIVIPVGGSYLLPELAAESWRTERVSAMAQFGRLSCGVIGFDCVPLTTAETVGIGMPGAFARNLSAVSHMTKVGAISEAAAIEYRGWRSMLSAAGVAGPDIQAVMLAAEAQSATDGDGQEFIDLLELREDLPLVLVVGSHEPRKNHMAVLQAAELLWRDGFEFQIAFVGGNSWNSLEFVDRVNMLSAGGRPVFTTTSLPDRLLWAAYRLARFTVFPSINEGFGLPIAESICCGTPVITSNFGSMREVGEGNGALLVDSRRDSEIAKGMRALLSDEELYATLKRQALAYRPRTWDEYAAELWDFFGLKRL